MNLEELKKRFTSGNSVPVERAYLTKDEFDRLLRVVEVAQGIQDAGYHSQYLEAALRDLEQS